MFRELFYIHKSDRRVILTLLLVMVVALTVILLAGGKEASNAQTGQRMLSNQNTQNARGNQSAQNARGNQSAQNAEGNQSAQNAEGNKGPQNAEGNQSPQNAQHVSARSLFPFDPNSADSSQLLSLGLPRGIVHNIYKYRAAGGIFRKKEDFARLYGLTVGQYRQLEPYIVISADYRPAADLFKGKPERPEKSEKSENLESMESLENPEKPRNPGRPSAAAAYPHKLSPGETIDLSTADTTLLMRIPGIGPYYARRIMDYGHRLGGYVSLEQLDEIDDFPQEAKQYMTLSHAPVAKLNINILSINELKRHPYINYYQARAIVDYRRQHGTISDLHELRLLPDFPDEVIARLLPYIEY